MKIYNLLQRTVVAVFMFGLMNSTYAQTVTTPRPVSPAAELKQTIGLTEITINYSRPKVISPQGQDRTGKIWGALVPYGFTTSGFGNGKPIPWRAGANENTTITISDDVKVEGKDLKAGTYGFFIEVKEGNEATAIFSNNSTSWGSFFYEESEDALRVPIKSKDNSFTQVLTYNLVDYTPNSCVLALDWEKKRFEINFSIDVHKIVLENFRNELRSTAGFGWQGSLAAARYCLNNNINVDEGIHWVDQSINNSKNFQNVFVKAGLLNLKGDTEGYNKMTDESAQLANIGQLNLLGYQLMGQGNLKKAIEFFELNVKRNPTDANVHDSLAEAYKANGDTKTAIKYFKKSLSLNPPPATKANSEKHLKELGVSI